jgi:hypothetical protein
MKQIEVGAEPEREAREKKAAENAERECVEAEPEYKARELETAEKAQ